jgi:hypothetical protein
MLLLSLASSGEENRQQIQLNYAVFAKVHLKYLGMQNSFIKCEWSCKMFNSEVGVSIVGTSPIYQINYHLYPPKLILNEP